MKKKTWTIEKLDRKAAGLAKKVGSRTASRAALVALNGAPRR